MSRPAAAVLAAFLFGSLALIPALASTGVHAETPTENDRIDRAAQVLDRFVSDPGNHGLRETLKRARAILVVPNYVRAGFVIGGTGGGGVSLSSRSRLTKAASTSIVSARFLWMFTQRASWFRFAPMRASCRTCSFSRGVCRSR